MADDLNLIELTAEIVSAHVANNTVAVGDVANLVQRVHEALTSLGQPAAQPEAERKTPAVSVRASIKPDYIVCLECGRKQKTLRRHLQTAHGLTPEQYRAEFGLQSSYPLTAPNYSKRRGEMARAIGLGRKRAPAAPGAESGGAPKAKGGRRKGAGRKGSKEG